MRSRFILNSATKDDCRDLWVWRNDIRVRSNFFNNRPISWQGHKKWFCSKIKDNNTKIYIGFFGKDKIGVIRFEIASDFVRTSVNINPEFFGMGFGNRLIRLGTQKFFNETKIDKPVIAEIKKDNTISQMAFAKSGYRFSKALRGKVVYENSYRK